MISLKRALEMMRLKDERKRFVPFSLEFVSCDSGKKTGGQILKYNHVTLPQRDRVELDSEDARIKAGKQPVDNRFKTTVKFKTDGGEFRQCHIHLITRFNGETVM